MTVILISGSPSRLTLKDLNIRPHTDLHGEIDLFHSLLPLPVMLRVLPVAGWHDLWQD